MFLIRVIYMCYVFLCMHYFESMYYFESFNLLWSIKIYLFLFLFYFILILRFWFMKVCSSLCSSLAPHTCKIILKLTKLLSTIKIQRFDIPFSYIDNEYSHEFNQCDSFIMWKDRVHHCCIPKYWIITYSRYKLVMSNDPFHPLIKLVIRSKMSHVLIYASFVFVKDRICNGIHCHVSNFYLFISF